VLILIVAVPVVLPSLTWTSVTASGRGPHSSFRVRYSPAAAGDCHDPRAQPRTRRSGRRHGADIEHEVLWSGRTNCAYSASMARARAGWRIKCAETEERLARREARTSSRRRLGRTQREPPQRRRAERSSSCSRRRYPSASHCHAEPCPRVTTSERHPRTKAAGHSTNTRKRPPAAYARIAIGKAPPQDHSSEANNFVAGADDHAMVVAPRTCSLQPRTRPEMARRPYQRVAHPHDSGESTERNKFSTTPLAKNRPAPAEAATQRLAV